MAELIFNIENTPGLQVLPAYLSPRAWLVYPDLYHELSLLPLHGDFPGLVLWEPVNLPQLSCTQLSCLYRRGPVPDRNSSVWLFDHPPPDRQPYQTAEEDSAASPGICAIILAQVYHRVCSFYLE